MKFYIISDTHFEHQQINHYCDRPDDAEERMARAMRQISDKHCLIHLGDIGIGQDLRIHKKYIQPLKCRKILTIGNHDSKSYSWYMEHGWDFVCESFKLDYAGYKLCMSHKPKPWDGEWDINIHGHLHNLGHRPDERGRLKEWHRLYAPETMGYKPVELKKFIDITAPDK